MATTEPNNTTTTTTPLSRLYFIYRGIANRTDMPLYDDVRLYGSQRHLTGVGSLHLLGWCAQLNEAYKYAQHFHDATYCGKRNYAYLINAYRFPFIVSQQERYHQREFEALESHIAEPTPKHTALVWHQVPEPGIRVATSLH